MSAVTSRCILQLQCSRYARCDRPDAFVLCAQHLDSTPNQYIQWRYGIGEDREQLQKVNLKVSEEEEKKMAEKQVRECRRLFQPLLCSCVHE